MFHLKGLLLFSYLIVLISGASIKGPAAAPWATYASKSAYARALGPPTPGVDTITVPYMPKSPAFPKFVDPKTMISKKTDLLTNLFGGLGPAYPMGFKPFLPPYAPYAPYTPYPASGPTLYSTADEAQLVNSLSKSVADEVNGPYKRGIFSPLSPKPFGPMSPKFGPMSPKFGPMSPKFGPMSPYSSFNAIPDYSMKDDYSRKRRSIEESPLAKLRAIMDNGSPETKALGPPPPYPTLAPISEEPEDDASALFKAMGSPTAPKQYLPGMFGPFGPFGPFAPAVDPSMMISKKTAFLDTLFKNLATTTPSPTSTEPSTESPTTKSTIVPPGFWFPSSAIPSPTEYNAKVADFLDKLFDAIKLNKTTTTSDDGSASDKTDFAVRSIKPDGDKAQAKIARSIEDLSSINLAKDTIVDSILSELGDLKSDMVATMNDLITYEKSTTTSAKKPFKPFAAGPWATPASDGTLPFQQKMTMLSQVFDMLTDLQKNITMAIENAISTKMAAATISGEPFNANYPTSSDFPSTTGGMPFNMSLLDAIKGKLDTMNYGTPLSYNPFFGKFGPSMARMVPKTPASFWVSYPEDTGATKREVVDPVGSLLNEESNANLKQQTRSVKMQMHQGYQSLPAGSVESVEAGGGSTPGHQGGGIKLLDANSYEGIDKWANWMEYLKNDYQGHRHHNHH